MMNKDYILRMFEMFGRSLAIILHLRQSNQHEDALIYIDNALLQITGLTSSFINSASEEMLLGMIAPLGTLNVEKCLWIAGLLKEEADIYDELENSAESYQRYVKSLFLFLELPLGDHEIKDFDIPATIEYILNKLAEYELPLSTNRKLMRYFEKTGQYAKAEDVLFAMIDAAPESVPAGVVEQGRAFYTRLLEHPDAQLQAGNVSRDQVEEGLLQLKAIRAQ